MNPDFPTRTAESFDLEDSDDLFGAAQQLIDGRHLGILTTVDSDGAPHSRWMATLACRDFPRILTLTAGNSRKVKHIRANPQVDWLFSNDDLSLVVNLKGEATVHTDTASVKRAWSAVEDKTRAYFLSSFVGRPAIAVIETLVERVDYTAAKSGFRISREIGVEPKKSSGKSPAADTPPKEHCNRK